MHTLIIHDFLDNLGGGEKLMLSLAKGLNADFASCNINLEVVKHLGFKDVKIIDLGTTVKLPPFKQIQASAKLAKIDTSKYDFVIYSGNWSHYGDKSTPHLWYCHTPVRAFYTDYKRLTKSLSFGKKQAFKLWASLHRIKDQKSVYRIKNIVANSKNTAERIKQFYQRDADIIYPGINTKKYLNNPPKDFWLSVNRIYPEKRVELQIEAFRDMPHKKLVIVGSPSKGDHSSEYYQKLIKTLPKNVEIISNVPEKKLIELYSNCRGFLATALDEDFGMTPVEAMASGKPVVATAEGGYLESIIHGETGLLCGAEKQSIIKAINNVDIEPEKYMASCIVQAAKFDITAFVKAVSTKAELILNY